MPKKCNILILGCSVSLRVRPKGLETENKVYSKLLEENLNKNSSDFYDVTNMAFSRAMVFEFLSKTDEIVQSNPDYVILNFGAVESPNREIPRWYSDVIFYRKWKSLHCLFNTFYRVVIAKYLRKPLVYLRLKSPWVSKNKFKRDFEKLIQFIQSNTSAKVIVLDVNQGNERIEKELPGSIKNYKCASEMMKKSAQEKEVLFVSLNDLNSQEHYPDGVHFSTLGHEIVSKRLEDIIKNGY